MQVLFMFSEIVCASFTSSRPQVMLIIYLKLSKVKKFGNKCLLIFRKKIPFLHSKAINFSARWSQFLLSRGEGVGD